MINKQIATIFKKGSRTYFYSSLFFPPDTKKEVFSFYAFVRKADDFVDCIPQKITEFLQFKSDTQRALGGEKVDDIVISSFVHVAHKYDLSKIIGEDFLIAMESDLHKNQYDTIAETENYMYGSAEVIGVAMAKIIGLSSEAYPYAQALGKAMQYANFIRDVSEDIALGRQYLPTDDLHRFGLENLNHSTALSHSQAFTEFMHFEISRFDSWQETAEKGFAYIPKRFLIPIKTASDMYKWTMEQIKKDPFVVYRKKIKPTIAQIMQAIVYNSLRV